jgi:acetoin utilization protein AcuB
MQVAQIMSRKLITISPDKRVNEALKMMQRHDIRHLPVVEGDRLLGWVTSRDLREVLLASMIGKITIQDVMMREFLTVSPETGVEEAARLAHEHKIGGMPVVEAGRLVGIITVMDLLGAFLSMLGLLQASSRLDLLLEDHPKALDAAYRLITQAGGEIINVALGSLQEGKRLYSFRLGKCDLTPILNTLEKHAIKVEDFIR